MTDINSLKRTIATYINDHRDIVPSFLQRILISMLDASQANEATLPIEEIVIDTENGDTIETAKTKVDTLTTLGFRVLVAPEGVVPFTTPSKAIILSMDESASSGVQIATSTQGDLLMRYCSNAEWSEWAPISGGGSEMQISDFNELYPEEGDRNGNKFIQAGKLLCGHNITGVSDSFDGFVLSLGWNDNEGYGVQIAFDVLDDSMYVRRYVESIWTSWTKIYPCSTLQITEVSNLNDFYGLDSLRWTVCNSDKLPFSSNSGYVISLGCPSSYDVEGKNMIYALQLAFDMSNDAMYMRRSDRMRGSQLIEWKDWVKVYPQETSDSSLSNGGTINGPLKVKDPGSTIHLTVDAYEWNSNQLISNISFSVEDQSLGQLGVGQLVNNGSIVPCFTDRFGNSYQIALAKDISSGGGGTATDTTSIKMQSITSAAALNSFLGSGVQYGYASSSVTGLPTDVLILSLGYSSDYGKQYAIDDESFRTWQRYKTLNSGWSEWVEINAASEFSLNLTPIGTLKRFDVKVYPVNNITVEYDKRIAYKTDVYGNILTRDIPDTELPNYALCLFYTTKTPTQSTPPFFGYVSRISLDTSLVDVLLGQVPIYVGDTRLNDYNNILDGSEGNVRACYGCYLALNKEITIIHTGTDTPNDADDPEYYSTISRRFISRNYTKKYTEYEQCFEINFSNESNKEYVSLPLADTTKTFILSATGVLYKALDGEVEWVPVSFNNDSSKLTITPEGSFIRITKNISDAEFVPTCKAYITIRYIEYD